MRKYVAYAGAVTVAPNEERTLIQIRAPIGGSVCVTGVQLSYEETTGSIDPVLISVEQQTDDGGGGLGPDPDLTPLVIGDIAAETTAISDVVGAIGTGLPWIEFFFYPVAGTYVRELHPDDYIILTSGVRLGVVALSPIDNSSVGIIVGLVVGEE